MKRIVFLICLIVSINSVYAQTIRYGYSLGGSINDITPNRKTIPYFDKAIEHLIINSSKNINIGAFASNNKIIVGLNIDAYRFEQDVMAQKGVTINDYHNDRNQFIIKNNDPDQEENAEENITDFGFNGLLSIYLFKKNNVSINFANEFGVKIVKDRTSSVILKEEGSNNYYRAEYSFNVDPLYHYSPRVEFIYTVQFFSSDVDLCLYSGAQIQSTNISTERTIIDVIHPNSSTLNNEFKVFSTTWLAGAGIRVLIW